MIVRAAAALAVLLSSLGGQTVHTAHPDPHAQWIAANGRAIAQIHDARQRELSHAAFLQTQRALDASPVPKSAAAPDARARAATILSNRRLFAFGLVQKAPPKTWWERLSDWFSERWSAAMKALFSRVRLPGQTSIAIGDILLVLSIVAFLALAGRLAWLYAPRSGAAGMHARALETPQDPALFYARALEAAAYGDYRAGVALLFAASLIALRLRSALHEDAAKTIGELRRAVRRTRPEFAAPFDRLAAALTRALYADATIDAMQWESAVAAYGALQSEVPSDAS